MSPLLLNLRIVGASLITLSLAHVFIARRLEWKADAARMTPLNRQIFHVHAFFICLVLTMMGVLCLGFPQALVTPTPLARVVLAGLAIFWGTRLIVQWFVYEREHWRGNRVNTIIHFVFSALWMYYAGVFAVAWYGVWRAR